ncbi:MAG: hypothetical protein RRC07_08560 [Anaerolineae bacterium]|nr:hypothetical protein [Anaerolineae bacterium]
MDPIRIVIDEEEKPVVHVAERQPASLATKTVETTRAVARGAQAGWERLPREQMVAVSRRGVVSGLRWLSRRIAALAERLGSKA